MMHTSTGMRGIALWGAKTGLEISLVAREPFVLEPRETAMQLCCLEGALWITQQGDPQDYILRANESFVPTRPGRLVVQSLSARGRVRVMHASHMGCGVVRACPA